MGEKDKKPDPQQRRELFADHWHAVYTFMPMFAEPVKMPELSVFTEAMERRFGRVEVMHDNPVMPEKEENLLSFALMDHSVFYKDKGQEFPSQLLLFGMGEFDRELWDEMIISNFHACPDAETILPACRYSLIAGNMMAAGLPRMEEYGILASYADLFLELFPECIGIYWPHSQSLTSASYYREPHWHRSDFHFLDGGLNLRMFRITGTEELLFDTVGFTAIGLPDLQFHCKNLDPDDVVPFLRNLAAYLYEEGDVIEDGNTVEGIHHEKWVCRREDAMAGPVRVVLDVNPGIYAGGNRQ